MALILIIGLWQYKSVFSCIVSISLSSLSQQFRVAIYTAQSPWKKRQKMPNFLQTSLKYSGFILFCFSLPPTHPQASIQVLYKLLNYKLIQSLASKLSPCSLKIPKLISVPKIIYFSLPSQHLYNLPSPPLLALHCST